MDIVQTMGIVLGGITAFGIFWLAVVWLVAQIGGWSKLAAVYPARRPFNETCWSLQNGRFRWGMSYNGVLKVCADAQALHLSVFFFFRPGHPPLSIPWEDIIVSKRAFLVELRCRRADSVPLRISPRLAERLEQASAGQWSFTR